MLKYWNEWQETVKGRESSVSDITRAGVDRPPREGRGEIPTIWSRKLFLSE